MHVASGALLSKLGTNVVESLVAVTSAQEREAAAQARVTDFSTRGCNASAYLGSMSDVRKSLTGGKRDSRRGGKSALAVGENGGADNDDGEVAETAGRLASDFFL